MRRLRVALVFLLVLVPLLPVRAAETSTIVLWHSFRGTEEKGIRTVVNAYNLQNEDKIVAVSRDGATFLDDVEKAIAAGEGPDLFVWAHDKIGAWARGRIILPLEGLVDSESLGTYLSNCLEALRYDGRLYGLPLSFETLIMFHNRDLVPEAPRTTREMIEVCRRISNPAEGRYGLVYERGNFYYHAPWFHGFGGRVYDDSGVFDPTRPALARSLAFARDLASVHRIIPDTVDWKRQMEAFNGGRAGILVSGPWAYGSITLDRSKLGIATLPYIDEAGDYAAPFLGVKGFYVSARTRDQRACGRALEFLTSAYSGYVMNIMAGYLPANVLAFEYNAVAADPVTARFKEQVLFSVPMPARPEMAHVWRVMMGDPATRYTGCMEKVLERGADPEAAGREALADYERLKRSGGR